MSKQVDAYHIPKNINQALELLAGEGERAAVVAGGTALALHLPSRVRVLVDVMRCGLEGIGIAGNRLQIGATTTAATLAATPELDSFAAVALREAAAAISAQPVRNQVTIGGNLVGTMSWSDLPVALMALEAWVRTTRHGGTKRTLRLGEFFATHPRKVLDRGEVITSVELSRPKAGTSSAYIKMARTVADVAMVSAAVVLRVERGTCHDVRIALGSVRPRCLRATQAERSLEGVAANDHIFARAADLAVADLPIAADMRASKEHRRRILGVAVRRALRLAYERATELQAYLPPRRPLPPPWPRYPPGPDLGTTLRVTVDGTPRVFTIQPDDNLLEVLRREGSTSVKRGCKEGYCGTCAVLVEGRLLNACLLLAPQVEGCSITTAAGIGTLFDPHPIQTALVDTGAVQCGFCTPGWVVATKSLLDQIPDPTDREACAAMDGNLCRCTGYVKPLEALHAAARVLREAKGRSK